MIGWIDPRLDRLLLQAAVSGRFDPAAMLKGQPEADVEAMAGELSVYCDEAPVETGLHWILKPAVRRQLLARLDRPISVQAALEGAPAPLRGDLFAVALRQLLCGRTFRPSRRDQPDPALEAARHSALQFSRFAPVVDQSTRSEAFDASRVRIAEVQKAAALDIVLPHRLFGRKAELARIRRFIHKKVKDDRPMLVAGVGGIGKSALVAATIRSWVRAGGAAILLDFDRPDLATGNPLPVTREFARQLETAWLGKTSEPFRRGSAVVADIRERIRNYEREAGDRSTGDDQFSFVYSSVVASLRADVPAEALAAPLLLVLDSFEVAGMRGHDVAQRVLDLVAYLQGELSGLRAIVSCRECPLPEEGGSTVDGRAYQSAGKVFGPSARRLRVEGLKPAAGSELLARHDRNRRFRNAAAREQAVTALGGNPLALLVLERFARDKPNEEIDALVADLESNEDFSAEFAQSFLYSRILERIRDPQVAALAHPGLVLRRVTPDLIRLVLAGPCGLGTLDEGRARAMFDKLAGEYWLVERQGSNLVRHRPDLRRLMLPGLFARPTDHDNPSAAERKRELRRNTIAVCEAAARFYAEGPRAGDPAHAEWAAFGEHERAAEVTYYRALAGAPAPPALPAAEAAGLRDYLGAGLGTLPLPWRAVARASLGDFIRLTHGERTTLTGALREQADLAFAETSLRAGHETKATATARKVQQTAGAETSRESRLRGLEHEIKAAFANADFFAATKPAHALLEAFGEGFATEPTRNDVENGRLWVTPVWEGLLAIVSAESVTEAKARIRWISPFSKGRDPAPWLLAVAPLIEAMAGAGQADRFRFELGHSRSIDGLRRLALLESRRLQPTGDEPADHWVDSSALELAKPGVMQHIISSGRAGADPRFGLAAAEFSEFANQLEIPRFTLGDLERAYSRYIEVGISWESIHASKPAELWKTLRGLTPELHAPAVRLLSALPNGAAIRIAEQIARSCAFWPDDLWFVLPGGEIADDRPGVSRQPYDPRLAPTLFQTADRCGGLATALNLLRDQSRPARWLVTMYDTISNRIFGGKEDPQ